MTFSPSIGPQLVELVEQLDDGKSGIATVWRELGYLARARGLLQPSYESVRRLVHAIREWRRLERLRLKRAAILIFESRPLLSSLFLRRIDGERRRL